LDVLGNSGTTVAVIKPHLVDCVAPNDDKAIPPRLLRVLARLSRGMPELDPYTQQLQATPVEKMAVPMLFKPNNISLSFGDELGVHVPRCGAGGLCCGLL
jgi:hypothetical protein